MELDTGVVGAGEAAAPERRGGHPEVAAVLLGQHVGRDLRRPEQRVQAALDRHRLVDALDVGGIRVVPPGVELDQGQPVGVVAVDLVGADGDEHGLGGVPAVGLEEVEGADRVGVEVVEGSAGGQVVAGLRRGVDDQLVAPLGEHPVDRLAVADVDVDVGVAGAGLLEALAVPGGVALRTEEVGPTVVVEPVDGEAQAVEEGDGLRADQPRRPRDEDPHRGGRGARGGWSTVRDATAGMRPAPVPSR